jgi:coronatine-insensitive protein 1
MKQSSFARWQANYVIGDSGLAELARCCKQLRRIRIEQCGDYDEITDEGVVTQEGLISISQGCAKLEYIAVHVYDITNAALRQIGANLKHLRDFRLRLLPNKTNITDLPIDDGVGALLEGCENLRRLALYLRPGGLTDAGLRYIGRHSPNVRWLLLGNVEVTDEGLLILSNGCPMLQKLEIRKCKLLSEHALAQAATRFAAETGSFRYMWVQDYKEPSSGRHLLSMRPQDRWNVELIPSFITVDLDQAGQLIPVDHAAQVLLYRSFAGRRADCPKNIKTSN